MRENKQPPGLSAFSLLGKTALVTGASRGIGRAIALTLAKTGADVILASRSEEDLKGVATEITRFSRQAWIIPTDVMQPSQIDHLIQRAQELTQGVDILVNNAGLNLTRNPFCETTDEEWNVVLGVNLIGPMRLLRGFGRQMISQGGGAIINIDSLTSIRGAPHLSIYSASKGGIQSLTKTLALEWAVHGIRVNAIAPGYVKTYLTRRVWSDPDLLQSIVAKIPMGRLASPEEIAPAAVFLASDAASFITGITLFVDGGWTAQ